MNGVDPLHILMLTSETTWRGGETQIDLLMRGLSERGHGVTLAAPPGSSIADWAASGIPVTPLTISGGFDVAAAFRLRRILQRDRYDIVHSHSSHAHSIAFLATLGWDNRPRLVVSRRVAFPISNNPLSRMKYASGADRYIAISAGVREVLVMGGVPREKIEIISSGVDLSKYAALKPSNQLRRELAIPDEAPLIGTIGALVPNKAHTDFIRASQSILRHFPDAYFMIVGEGPLQQQLRSLARDLQLQDRMIFTGFREDPIALLSLCDCFVISSILEGLCTSIMDAQLAGVPVVATRSGGIPDLVTDGETGLLVAPRQPEQLAAAVMRMLAEPDLRSRCITNGTEKAGAYDYQIMVARTEVSYRAVIDE